MAPQDNTKQLLTPAEVAAWMQVTPDWVKEMARSGAMPAMKLGRYWRFDRAEVARWLEERKHVVHTRRT